jgi:hypothetical protein
MSSTGCQIGPTTIAPRVAPQFNEALDDRFILKDIADDEYSDFEDGFGDDIDDDEIQKEDNMSESDASSAADGDEKESLHSVEASVSMLESPEPETVQSVRDSLGAGCRSAYSLFFYP